MARDIQRGRTIDGRAYAAELMEEVKDGVRALDGAVGIATLLVGEDYAAQVYQRRIDRHAHEAGVFSRPERLPADASLPRVLALLDELDRDPRVSGILVLRPLPAHLPESDVLRALPRLKDVEAQHPENAGLLALGTPRFTPSTAAAAFYMLDRYMASVGRDPRPRPQRDRHLRPQAHRRRGPARRAHAHGRPADRGGRRARPHHRRLRP
jgi:methylenetetrahydrofolate dehydrogenase (NADP+)/methenyltetrahydrofolate cyclohydrolase